MSLYAVALSFPFNGTKEPCMNDEKQPQIIIPPEPNSTIVSIHWGRWCSPGRFSRFSNSTEAVL
jgi:hypothetical protein